MSVGVWFSHASNDIMYSMFTVCVGAREDLLECGDAGAADVQEHDQPEAAQLHIPGGGLVHGQGQGFPHQVCYTDHCNGD